MCGLFKRIMDFINSHFELIVLILGLVLIGLLIVLLCRQPSRKQLSDSVRKGVKRMREETQDMLDSQQDVLQNEFWKNEQRLDGLRTEQRGLKEDILRTQAEEQRQLLESLGRQSRELTELVSGSLTHMQESNEQKLEQMRETVDEKLSRTLNERLSQSFEQVSEQLQKVYVSLGEMQTLAGDVSDLQRVLTNVKARGTWAEVQLGSLLEQTLSSGQYARNVSPRNNSERVEFAVKIPSREEEGAFIWLPIDSKFPQEDYLRILEAAENADREGLEKASRALELNIRKSAQTISSLYLEVPKTTDFAIMFLPTEGLYAEVLRLPGLSEEIQRKYHVMICGPTTITAFLNTLRVGFRTIALDKQASQVWKLLEATKAQYEVFGRNLEKAQKKIAEAGKAIEDAQSRSVIIHKKLKGIDTMEEELSSSVLGITGDALADASFEEKNGEES